MFKLPHSMPAGYDFAQRMFVAFVDFEPVAEQDAHRSVTKREIAAFEASIELGDPFWCTQRGFGAPIVFVHTEAQAEAVKSTDLPGALGRLLLRDRQEVRRVRLSPLHDSCAPPTVAAKTLLSWGFGNGRPPRFRGCQCQANWPPSMG